MILGAVDVLSQVVRPGNYPALLGSSQRHRVASWKGFVVEGRGKRGVALNQSRPGSLGPVSSCSAASPTERRKPGFSENTEQGDKAQTEPELLPSAENLAHSFTSYRFVLVSSQIRLIEIPNIESPYFLIVSSLEKLWLP